jgi:glutamine synthetase
MHSYKRLVENYWAPVTVSWGVDNRLGAIRVIVPPSCSEAATRLEMVSVISLPVLLSISRN